MHPEMGWIVFAGEVPGEAREREVTALDNDIRVTGSLDILSSLTTRPSTELRLLLGYAGWGPGQLESELNADTHVDGALEALREIAGADARGR